MPLPEIIPVKYTEEEADYLSMRPLVRQDFRASELVDMIVRVAGKELARVQQILRSGTVVFQSYRYWWQGFEAEGNALRGMLAVYPDSDASRPFRAEECREVLLEAAAVAKRHPVAVTKEEASRKALWRVWRRGNFWSRLMELGRSGAKYREYSYGLRGDVYSLAFGGLQATELERDAARLAARPLRIRLGRLSGVVQVSFVCPRVSADRHG